MSNQKHQPLANILRPKTFDEIIGQKHLLESDGILTRIRISGRIPSLILWGEAGCGKTTIAKILAASSNLHFDIVSATNSGVADLRKIFEAANKRKESGLGTVLMVDEIHRFNRSQQDLFLPLIEDGTIILIAATTQNPSFEINSALLSRCRIIRLNPLSEIDLGCLLLKAEDYYNKKLLLEEDAKKQLFNMASGDGRYFLNMCEELFSFITTRPISSEQLFKLVTKRAAIYDKNRDAHYGLISALHKSLRGSNPDAGLYYLSRMLQAGEDPHYILRRLVRFASEDIGMADPNALVQALAAKNSYDFLGSPEGDYAIANAVIYCATAPKSNACYIAYKKAFQGANEYNSLSPPKHILNAPTAMMRDMGYKEGYIYDHDTKNTFSGQEYFPDDMAINGSPEYYTPNKRGFEREIIKRLQYWKNLKKTLDL